MQLPTRAVQALEYQLQQGITDIAKVRTVALGWQAVQLFCIAAPCHANKHTDQPSSFSHLRCLRAGGCPSDANGGTACLRARAALQRGRDPLAARPLTCWCRASAGSKSHAHCSIMRSMYLQSPQLHQH